MISIVIPLYNEEDSLAPLHGEIVQATGQAGLEYEIWFVDDGSRDRSWAIVQELAKQDERVHGIRFRRNFGKAAALSAGFRAVRGDIVMTLDADLQDDPKEIPRFLEEMNKGFDVVSGWKKVRLDPWHKTGPSKVFNWLVGKVTGVKLNDHNCGMKSYRTEIFKEVHLYGELHRFIPVLAAARGWKVGEIAINHRPRKYGQGKYMGAGRFMKGFLDLMTVKFLTGFRQRPQHLLGTVGLVSFLLGNFALLYLAFTWLVRLWDPNAFRPIHERALTFYALGAVLMGAQLMSIGFLAELITAYQGRNEYGYSIAETTESGQRSAVSGQQSESAAGS